MANVNEQSRVASSSQSHASAQRRSQGYGDPCWMHEVTGASYDTSWSYTHGVTAIITTSTANRSI